MLLNNRFGFKKKEIEYLIQSKERERDTLVKEIKELKEALKEFEV